MSERRPPRVVPSRSALRDGVIRNVPGNYFDKHGSRNPLIGFVMQRFHSRLLDAIRAERPESILDVGCGEGNTTHIVAEGTRTPIVGIELEELALDRRVRSRTANFVLGSAYQLPFAASSFDLVMATEVLEHLDDPRAAVIESARVARSTCLFTVPREPLFRAANMARGAYLSDFGNTPGHIQHWSLRSLRRFLEDCGFADIEVSASQVWSLAVCQK